MVPLHGVFFFKITLEGGPNADSTTQFDRLFCRRSRLQSRKWSGGDDHKFGRALGPDMPRWPAVAQTGTPVRINQAAAVCLKVCGVNIVRRRW